MNKKKEEEKRVRLAEELKEQYGEVLHELSRMPKETKEDKAARWKWFQTHLRYESLFMKVMEAYSPSGYEMMIRCKGSGDLAEMSGKRTREISSEEFLLAVKETVEGYMEEKAEAGKEGSFFVSCVGQKYRQNIQKAGGAYRYDQGSPMPEIPYDRKCQVIKYVNEIKKMIETGEIKEYSGFWEERRKEVCRSKDWNISKKEWDAAVCMVYNMNMPTSMNQSVGDEEDGMTREEMFEDLTERAEAKTEREAREEQLGNFIQNMAQDWKYVKCAANKRSREWIRIFLTKDILIELKLDSIPELTDREKKQWKDCEPEPHCRQWCSRRKTCSREKTGCYIRYRTKPAGNAGIYEILSPHDSVIYHNLLVKAYIDRAIEGEPENLYEVYENYLRKDFDFQDRILGEVIHKDKSAVSRARSDYEGKIRNGLYRQFLEEREYN